MSRHRGIRNRQYSYDYDDDYYEEEDDMAQSYDEDAHRMEMQMARQEAGERARKAAEEQQRKQRVAVQEAALAKSCLDMGFAPDAVKKAIASATDAHPLLDRDHPLFQEALMKVLTKAPPTVAVPMSPPRRGGWAAAHAPNNPSSEQKRSSVIDIMSPPTAPPAFDAMPPLVLNDPPNFSSGKSDKSDKSPALSTTSNSNSNSNSNNTNQQQSTFRHVLYAPSAAHDLPDDSTVSKKTRLTAIILGHVDHGKSTLTGRLLYDMKHVDERTMRKYEKQCQEIGKGTFQFAWVMDTSEAERERGVTMEVGTKHVDTANHRLTLLDAPGHSDFVPQVIAGLSEADVAILVVSAKTFTDSNTGEFERGFIRNGQTTEHVLLGKGLGIHQIVVAVNKMDQANTDDGTDAPFSQSKFNEIVARMTPYLAKKGFNVAKKVKFVPCSGLTGENVASLSKECPLAAWYQGPTLLQAIDEFTPVPKVADKPLRCIVSDTYPERAGVCAHVRVVRGELRAGETVALMPVGDVAVVGRISIPSIGVMGTSTDAKRVVALPGDNVEVYLPGVDPARIARGFVLCHSRDDLRVTVRRKFRAKIIVLDDIGTPIIKGSELCMHMQAMECPVVLYKLLRTITFTGKGQVDELKPRLLTSGVTAECKLVTKRGLCLETFLECRGLGRFVLRRGTQTVAMGVIEELY
jgi:elongation factor 1 alpha-like protein